MRPDAMMQVGAVEARRPHAHQHLAGRRLGLGHIADLDPARRQHRGLHGLFSKQG